MVIGLEVVYTNFFFTFTFFFTYRMEGLLKSFGHKRGLSLLLNDLFSKAHVLEVPFYM